MQCWSLWRICHAIMTCSFWAYDIYDMPSLHAVLRLARHMPCHHYMQVWSIWSICHALIKCNFWAWEAYAMPSAIMLHCLVLLCIISSYFILYWTLSLSCPMCPKLCGLQDMYHLLIICSPVDWAGISHGLSTCSPGACQAYAMPSFMQFLSLWHMCHALTTCSSIACGAHAMSPLCAGLGCMVHMPCLH